MPDGGVKLCFTSGSEDLVPSLLEEFDQVGEALPILVVGEFAPPKVVARQAEWVPWIPTRSEEDNWARIEAALAGRTVRFCAILLQPNMPYWQMRRSAFRRYPRQLVAFNENLNHFMLRPRSVPTILRHLRWRAGNWWRWQTRPGGGLYTWYWRLLHPSAFVRIARFRLALLAGQWAARRRNPQPVRTGETALPEGISVVVPSRNGKQLLATLLPTIVPQLPARGEIIVSDNGSQDGTTEWLAQQYPQVRVVQSAQPLSFAAAMNRGAAQAKYRRLCALNNDMEASPGFFAALEEQFAQVPNLFAATAQIFFPEGQRRQETGKAMYSPSLQHLPLRCVDPLEGESGSWVLYGSGGCTLYDTAKFRALGGFNEELQPAYVEDLELGYRAWRHGWPSVYAGAAHVLHHHRSTTAKVFDALTLETAVQLNYLRHLLSATCEEFRPLWGDAILRLHAQSCLPDPDQAARAAMRQAWRLALAGQPKPQGNAVDDAAILALNQGAVAVFRGQAPASGRPRILIASCYPPFPLSHGGAVRMYNLIREAASEFEIILQLFADELATPAAELLALCREVVVVRRLGSHLHPERGLPDVVEDFYREDFRYALEWSIRKWQPKVVQLEFTQLAVYAPFCQPAKTVLVEHDITLDLYGQLLQEKEEWELRRQYERWVRFETEAWKNVDAVVVMSEKDRLRVARPNAVTLANGVDLARFQPAEKEPEAGRLLFIGSFGHLPNVMALDFFLREVWPLLRAMDWPEAAPTLHVIAGMNHQFHLERYAARVQPPLETPGVMLEGFVSDVRQAYHQAAIVVAPLKASAGTNIKILEAMAMGKAIVSTPGGINGLDLRHGEELLVAETAESMAAAIARLLRNPAERVALEKAARRAAEQDWSWQAIGQAQAALYRQLAEES